MTDKPNKELAELIEKISWVLYDGCNWADFSGEFTPHPEELHAKDAERAARCAQEFYAEKSTEHFMGLTRKQAWELKQENEQLKAKISELEAKLQVAREALEQAMLHDAVPVFIQDGIYKALQRLREGGK